MVYGSFFIEIYLQKLENLFATQLLQQDTTKSFKVNTQIGVLDRVLDLKPSSKTLADLLNVM
jgi:hypothetical protein